MKLSETERAYLAGFFDGDGCISIVIASPKSPNRQHTLQVSIVQANKYDLVFWQQRTKLGNIYSFVNKSQEKEYYQWMIVSKNCEKFLQLIYPYLRIKRSQADVAFEFRQTFLKNNRKRKLSKFILNERERLYLEMRKIKKDIKS